MPRHNIWGERRGCTLLPAGGDLAVVTGRDPGDGRAVLAVFYNGDCGSCRTRIAAYQTASIGRSRLIAWCDVARTPWALRRWGIDANRARQRMHVVDAAGRVYGGAAAFGQLWRELPGHRSLGLLIRLPGIGLLAEGFYRLNLAVNPAYRDLGRASCGARHA